MSIEFFDINSGVAAGSQLNNLIKKQYEIYVLGKIKKLNTPKNSVPYVRSVPEPAC